MTNNKRAWEEVYWEKFNNRVGGCFECCEAEILLDDIRDFILKVEDTARKEERKIIKEEITQFSIYNTHDGKRYIEISEENLNNYLNNL